MKTTTDNHAFYAGGFHTGTIRKMHIETDGAMVDIEVGLRDADGRTVTRVDVTPEDETRGGDHQGRIWARDGARVVRLNPGETHLPGKAEPHPPLTVSHAHLLSRLANAIEHGRRVRFIPDGVDDDVAGTLRHIVKADSDAFLTDEDMRDGRVRITLDFGSDVYLPVPAVLTRMEHGEFGIDD